jgi:hypothetical protein
VVVTAKKTCVVFFAVTTSKNFYHCLTLKMTEEDDNLFNDSLEQIKEGIPFYDILINWVGIANKYTLESEKITNQIFGHFPNPSAFKANKNIIKRIILEGLGSDAVSIYFESEKLKRTPRKKQEEQVLWTKRQQIQKTYNKLYIRLGNETYGQNVFSTPLPAIDNASASEKSGKKKKNLSSVKTNLDETQLSEQKATSDDKDEPESDDGDEPEIDDEVKPASQVKRNRWKNKPNKKTLTVQDLFGTHEQVVHAIYVNLMGYCKIIGKEMNELVVFEPCHGTGNITNVLLRDFGVKEVIKRDKFTLNESHDYLVCDNAVGYDVMITNPPFKYKKEFLKRAREFGKPFIMLLPIQTMIPTKNKEIFENCHFHLQVLSPCPPFHVDEGFVEVGDCAWFYLNFPKESSTVEIFYWKESKLFWSEEEILVEQYLREPVVKEFTGREGVFDDDTEPIKELSGKFDNIEI